MNFEPNPTMDNPFLIGDKNLEFAIFRFGSPHARFLQIGDIAILIVLDDEIPISNIFNVFCYMVLHNSRGLST